MDQNLTIAGDRAGGASGDGRCDECFRAGFGVSEFGCGASVTAGAAITGAGALGRGGSAIGGRPTTNSDGWPDTGSAGCDTAGAVAVWSGGADWPPIGRKPTASCFAGERSAAAGAAGAGSTGVGSTGVGSTGRVARGANSAAAGVRSRSLSQ